MPSSETFRSFMKEILGFLGRVLGFLLRSTFIFLCKMDGQWSQSWAALPNRSKLPKFQCKIGWAAPERLRSSSRAARAELEQSSSQDEQNQFCCKKLFPKERFFLGHPVVKVKNISIEWTENSSESHFKKKQSRLWCFFNVYVKEYSCLKET